MEVFPDRLNNHSSVVWTRVLRLVESGNLCPLECEDRRPRRGVSEIQYAKCSVLHPGHRLNTNEPIAEQLGEHRKCLELGSRVGEVVAMRIDDRCPERPI